MKKSAKFYYDNLDNALLEDVENFNKIPQKKKEFAKSKKNSKRTKNPFKTDIENF